MTAFFGHHVLDKLLGMMFQKPLYRLPFVKRLLQKQNMNTYDDWIKKTNKPFEDPEYGVYMFVVNKIIAFIIIGPILLLTNIMLILTDTALRPLFDKYAIPYFIILLLFSWAVSYMFLWKDSVYLKFFERFEKESSVKKVVWGIGITLYVIALSALCFWTLIQIRRN